MATMEEKREALYRQPVWVLEIDLDQCTLENGVSPCTASESCYFTYPTCKDVANYDKGSVTYYFINRGAPHFAGCWPYLKKPIKHLPTKINEDEFKSERGVIRFKLQEDDAHPKANAGKSTSQTDSGYFFRNLIARNPNYKNRMAALKKGYYGVDYDDFETYWRGILQDIQIKKDEIEIKAKDLLWKADEKKAPPKISDNNTVQDSGGMNDSQTSMAVTDADEFLDATSEEPRQVQVEDEIMEYTYKTGNNLMGISRGVYGTSAASHAEDTAIEQVLCYGVNDDFGTTGITGDRILYDLLCNLAGIDASYIAVNTDGSITCNGAVGSSDTSISLNNASELPSAGVIKINSEMIIYTGNDGSQITGCKRGVLGTTAASHSDTDSVYPTTATYELGLWRQGSEFQGLFKDPKKVKELVQSLSKALLLNVWQNESGNIETVMQAPPLYDDIVHTLTEADMVEGSRKVTLKEEDRITRVWLYFDAADFDAGESPDDYTGLRGEILANEESDDFFGDVSEMVIYSPWVFQSGEARWLVDHIAMKFERATPEVEFKLELYYNDIETGDIVKLTVPEIVDEDGNAKEQYYRVISKERQNANLIKLITKQAGFADARYPIIAPASLTEDYDDAAVTDEEKEKYGWIANTSDELPDGTDAYIIY